MSELKLCLAHTGLEERLSEIEEDCLKAAKMLKEKSGQGKEFTGWLDLPLDYDRDEFDRIKKAAQKIRKTDCLVVIGIGGSYLGAKAVIDSLKPTFPEDDFEVIFLGNDLSPKKLHDYLLYLEDKDFSINVISKSGTTTEPAIAFRAIREIFDKKYQGQDRKDRLFITTDREKGALKKMADAQGLETFVVPDEVGGRYSVLTAVGLLPIAALGADLDQLMKGAEKAREIYLNRDFEDNDALKYASMRNLLYREGKKIELLVNYDPRFKYFAEWWKQLFGESEGKDGKGLFPASANFTTDLHSLGQLIQDGERNIFETVIAIENEDYDVTIKEDEEDLDGLNYLSGKSLSYVNKQAMEGTLKAHVEGGVPNIRVTIDRLNEENLGHLIYFFEYACGVSGYILGVNPFNQPGVELYKKNMFRLLGKPGY